MSKLDAEARLNELLSGAEEIKLKAREIFDAIPADQPPPSPPPKITIIGGTVGESAGEFVGKVAADRPFRQGDFVRVETYFIGEAGAADITPIDVVVMPAPGSTEILYRVPVLDDHFDEADERFGVRIAEVSRDSAGTPTLEVEVAEAFVTIVDDDEAPPPVEPPPPTDGVPSAPFRTMPVNMGRTLCFHEYHSSSRYERYENATKVPLDAPFEFKFHNFNFVTGGSENDLPVALYRMFIDGVEVAQFTPSAAGQRVGTFKLSPATMAPFAGRREILVKCDDDPAATPVPHWVQFGSKAETWMPVWTGSYDLTHSGSVYFSFKVPARFTPTARPLVPRQATPFADALPPAQMHRTNITPNRGANIFRPNRFADGTMHTANNQAYFWQDYMRKLPTLPLLDGPRGVNTIQCPTHIQGDRHGNPYCTDSWSLYRVDEFGSKVTRAGWYHDGVFSRDNSTLKLKGIWNTPVKGWHEVWGLAIDDESTRTDPNAPPVNGEQPHPGKVRMFVPDSQNNRVSLVEFDGRVLGSEAVVSDLITGRLDPWDAVCVGKVLYVSLRLEHEIGMFDKDTGAYLGPLIKGDDLATVDQSRFVRRKATLDICRASPCVAPEGLFYLDGWLYWASRAQEWVRMINLETGEQKTGCLPTFDINSNFCKITVSDGSFGPRGTMFVSTWSNANFGLPQAFLPGGTKWGWNSWSSPLSNGRGGQWQALGYPSSCGIFAGKLVLGSSEEGLVMITKALPTDPTLDQAKYQRGADAYRAKGYTLLHGDDGFGFYGFPLPIGENPDMDYYLKAHHG